MRSSYEVFLERFNENSCSQYKIISVKNDKKYYFPYAKVINTKTIMQEYYNTRKQIGVYIDVFPLDNLGDSYLKAIMTYKRINFFRDLNTLKLVKVNAKRGYLKNIILKIGQFCLCKKTSYDIANHINEMAIESINDDTSTFVGNVVFGPYGVNEIMERRCFTELVLHVFEGRQYYIPKEYDSYLKRIYGDYMTLPHEHKRGSHHTFDAFWL